MELFTIAIVCVSLLICVILQLPIVYALILGFFVFIGYGLKKTYTLKSLLKMSLSGVKSVKNVLIVFLLIGMLTAMWRASGTIPTIIAYASQLIHPSLFLLLTFLLNCGVSLLIGTAFGTGATMGVICMTMATTMEINPLFVGGAVLSGVYFGDRCSPVSSSALLVSEITNTNLFDNIKYMLKSAAFPFVLTCGLYTLLGLLFKPSGGQINVQSIFSSAFSLHWVALLPAAVMLVLALLRVNVKTVMAISIFCAVILCLTLQEMPVKEMAQALFTGYKTENLEIAKMVNGGGISSMLNVIAIVCVSSSYSGIFEGTGLLNKTKDSILKLSEKMTPFGAMILTSFFTGMVACNQVLTILLTNQLCKDLSENSQEYAIDIENSAVVIAALVPWSLASTVPLSSIGAPPTSIFFAFFLYLLPAWHFATKLIKQPQKNLVTSQIKQ